MNDRYDAVVIGLGAMGSAAFFELAKRGARVLGIEQFDPGHDRGSSHGESRIIRLAYFEHPSYVPLVQEARHRWAEIQQRADETIFLDIGCVEIGFPGAPLIRRSLEAARQHSLHVDEMDARDIRMRFPAFDVPDDWTGHFQADGGLLIPELAIKTFVREAVRLGGTLMAGTKVRRIESGSKYPEIDLGAGRVSAERVIVTAGAWLTELVDIPLPLEISRQVVGWFEPQVAASFTPEALPVFLLATPDNAYYGFPNHRESGWKAASHLHGRSLQNADALRQDAAPDDEAQIRRMVSDYMPDGNGPLRKMQTCMYTNTPDGHFLIDRAAHDARIIVASACSGHGFKFAPVIGAILADMAEDKTPAFPIDGFSADMSRRLSPVQLF
ncbi:N-methyl-L-tryptophan oxidase [Bradyrhizobium jicamae]|uniref:N-methyl-L-tryptophan oxidase n=1 Tax=Bradyrhizobium jicamae TaxID=280332 RepID=UPI001BA821AE|nr:N-methyl-L-tryptophan oxidase [Bradyrhizobium jicamae]MBR0757099.1 N-methyl-L-tryptophan oxidase [Bradyrhizobium jicamae]